MLFETQIAVAQNKAANPQDWVWEPAHVMMSEERLKCLTEVRVEQFADDITKFSIEMHYEADKNYPRNDHPLAGDSIVIISGDNGKNKVLVAGPVLEVVKENKAEGKSLVRYSGVDVRKALGAIGILCTYRESTVSDTVEYVIGQKFASVDVDTPEHNGPNTEAPLTQTGNHLEFIKSLAQDHGFHFWFSYSLSSNPSEPNKIEVEPTAHFKKSPFFEEIGTDGGLPVKPIVSLTPSTEPLVVKVFVAPNDCPNVLNFNLTRNSERQSSVAMSEIDPATLKSTMKYNEAERRTEYNLEPNSLNIMLTVPDAPDQPNATAQRAELLEQEESFVASALINTKKRLIGHILEPHQKLTVKGAEPPPPSQKNSPMTTSWRVKDVVHVIRSFDHFMDVTIETNALPAAEGVSASSGLGAFGL